MNILGVYMSGNLKADADVSVTLATCAGSLYVLRVLKHRGLSDEALQEVTRATTMAKFLYAIPACKKGFNVRSFGSGMHVKLPGLAPDRPNIYDFNTTYDEMYKDLLTKDSQLYTQNGILHMLDRNRRIKPRPERFQSCKEHFDIIVTCEERVYDQVVEDLESREKFDPEPTHVINIDIQDNHEEATIGAFMICDLCTLLAQSEDLDNDVDELLQEFESRCQRTILHTLVFY